MLNILLGISGSIAAYKTPELIRQLKKAGVVVTPVLTEGGSKFVTPLSISTVAEISTLTNLNFFDPSIPHLSVLKDKHVLVIAPASANVMARCAYGFASDFLSSLVLSYQGPIVMVPAMHTEMYHNPATQANINLLKKRGVHILGPDRGALACGDSGDGRLVDLDLIVKKVCSFANPPLNLLGKKIVITAGGTTESIDAVRAITNGSTGLLGNEIAQMASFYGAQVTLLTSKGYTRNPDITVKSYETFDDLNILLADNLSGKDVLVMSAAVSDYTVETSDEKIKRQDNLTLNLIGTHDILKKISEENTAIFKIGFCLATHSLAETMQKKLAKKKVDVMVGNLHAVIGKVTRDVLVQSAKSGEMTTLNNASLQDIAYTILKTIPR